MCTAGIRENRTWVRIYPVPFRRLDEVPVEWRDASGETRHALAKVIDFRDIGSQRDRFLAVRELKVQGMRVPHYNRGADLVCS